MTNPDSVFGALGAALSAYATAQDVMVTEAQNIDTNRDEHDESTTGENK